MYKNSAKLTTTVCLWSVIHIFAFMGAFIFLGVTFDGGPFDDPIPMISMFLICAGVCIFLIVMYWRRFIQIGTVIRLNNLFMADEDGYVPLKDLCSEMGIPEYKLLNKVQTLLRKGYLINLNYNATEKVFLLSDKVGKPGRQIQGAPENKPFIGIHCPGCAASLKIRANTKGNCPYCGRELIAPAYNSEQ